MNHTLINDGFNSFTVNVTMDHLAVFTKMLIYMSYRIPESNNDRNFQKEVVKTVVDFEKSSKGLQNNFMVSKIIESFTEHVEPRMQFPLKKVSPQLDDTELHAVR
jgi:hypothetical protein